MIDQPGKPGEFPFTRELAQVERLRQVRASRSQSRVAEKLDALSRLPAAMTT